MTENSCISRLILSMTRDELLKYMEEKNVQVKFEGNYAIFNYRVLPREVENPDDPENTIKIPTDYTDPVVQEARGIVLHMKTGDVACWPFRKFGNWQEPYADKIDWESARIVEKVDGSITKLWFDKEKQDWVWSTNGTIFAEDAPVSTTAGRNFLNLIKETVNYEKIPFGELDKNSTYIFELTGPENKVVVNYDVSELYYLGTRSNLTGKESNDGEGIFKHFKQPKTYKVGEVSLEQAVALAKTLNAPGECNYEGFVVVDKDYNRVKVKTDEYFYLHKMASVSEKNIIKSLLDGMKPSELCEMVPKKSHIVMYYAYKIEELLFMADEIASYARTLFEEYSHNRRAVYEEIKGLPLFNIGMKAIGNSKPGREIFLSGIDFAKTVRNSIPPYEEPDILESKRVPYVKEHLVEDATCFNEIIKSEDLEK